MPLLDRTQKTPVLTEAGQVVYDYAQRILGLRDQVGQAIAEMQSLKRGLIRVGANESTSLYLLPELILKFRERHPEVKVEIFRHVSNRLPREVLDRNIDFALMASEPADRDLDRVAVRHLLQGEQRLLVAPGERLQPGLVEVGRVRIRDAAVLTDGDGVAALLRDLADGKIDLAVGTQTLAVVPRKVARVAGIALAGFLAGNGLARARSADKWKTETSPSSSHTKTRPSAVRGVDQQDANWSYSQ